MDMFIAHSGNIGAYQIESKATETQNRYGVAVEWAFDPSVEDREEFERFLRRKLKMQPGTDCYCDSVARGEGVARKARQVEAVRRFLATGQTEDREPGSGHPGHDRP